MTSGSPVAAPPSPPRAAGIIVVNTWYYIEVRATLGDSPNGAVIVRVNGTEVLNTTSLDTKGGGTKTVYDQIRLVRPSGSGTINSDYDDLYLRTGSAETFRGDVTDHPTIRGGGSSVERDRVRRRLGERVERDQRSSTPPR